MTRYLCDETKTTIDNAFEISIFEEALRHDPDNIEVLLVLGHTYTREQMYEKGMTVDRRLVALLPDNPICHYNLGCSYALVGDPDRAFESLNVAIVLGYDDFDHLKLDPDLDSLREDPRYQEILDTGPRSTT